MNMTMHINGFWHKLFAQNGLYSSFSAAHNRSTMRGNRNILDDFDVLNFEGYALPVEAQCDAQFQIDAMLF